MKKASIIGVIIYCLVFGSSAQEIPTIVVQQLESMAESAETEVEDDSYLQELSRFIQKRMNINTAEKEELKELRILSDLQVENFISYRSLLGSIIDIYELQAVPLWDIITIRRLLPFITIEIPVAIQEEMGSRFKKGEHSLLFRISQVMEKSKEFIRDSTGSKYLGGPQKIFFRHKYIYKNLLQYGFTGEKDAGEQFFNGSQKTGFDFYSFHLFIRKIGVIKALAVGDYSVSMGQGLIHWQGMAFKMSAGVMNVKRQSPVLRPYSSAGEFNFHRGVGITVYKNKFEGTVFISLRKLSGVIDDNGRFFSSFLTSGYHRSQNELDNKNDLSQIAGGGNINYSNDRIHIGVNMIGHRFSLPLQKRTEPYNLFAIKGGLWYNASIDYDYTYKNFHAFGEVAIDKNFQTGILNGLLVSVDQKVDISIVHRAINREYQSINGNAFTENTSPSNENGIYAGITIRPSVGLRLDGYVDVFRFPWLRYRVDRPSAGKNILLQFTYTPNRKVEVYTQFRNKSEEGNLPGSGTPVNAVLFLPKQNWRIQINTTIDPAFTLRNRFEMVWYDKRGSNKEMGFLTYFDCLYKPLLKSISGVVRLQYFETDGYNSRLYAFENDVMYSYSVPLSSGKGYRYSILLNYDLSKQISCWLHWVQTIYMGHQEIANLVSGNKKSEIKFQVRVVF